MAEHINPDVRVDAVQLRVPSSLALGDPQGLAHDIGHALGHSLGPDRVATITRLRVRVDEQDLQHQPAEAIARAIARQLHAQETPR